MFNLLITGATGFVGKVLVESLNEKYAIKTIGRSNVSTNSHLQANINKNTDYSPIITSTNVVIHLAARVHVMDEQAKNPIDEFRAVNTHGTLNLASQAAAAGVKRFIFISTIKVNGESTSNGPVFSAQDTAKPEDPYGISKAEAEQQLLELGKNTGMEIVIIRPPLVYGKGVKANFAALMTLVNKGFPLPFRLIKSNRRSLVSVYNLVDLIKVCIEHPHAANKIFLVSDDHDLSTAEMVSLMAKCQKKRNFAVPVPVWCFNFAATLFNKSAVIDRLTGSLQVDITHTKNTLMWSPPYTVEQGFKLAANLHELPQEKHD
jgi:nucleoside-diphosphate-sugar epimerase